MAKLPEHLFIASNGDLFDTRETNWSAKPLRTGYSVGNPKIETVAQFKAALRAGQFTDLGGYPLYFITDDGESISFEAAKDQFACVARSIEGRFKDGWRVVACEVNYEDNELVCGYTNKRIPSAYGEDTQQAEPAFKVEGVDDDGTRTELAAFDNSGEARGFLSRYTARENAGNWDLIEVYDTRGEDSERIAFWSRSDD